MLLHSIISMLYIVIILFRLLLLFIDMSGFTRLSRLIQFVCFESNVVICLGAGRTCSTSFKLFIEVILFLWMFTSTTLFCSESHCVFYFTCPIIVDILRPFWRENCDELNYRVAPPTPNCDKFVTSIYTMSWKAMWSVKLDLISQAFGKADAIFFFLQISHFCRPLFWQRCFLCSYTLILNSANIYLQERPNIEDFTILSRNIQTIVLSVNTSVEVASWNRHVSLCGTWHRPIAVLLQ